MIRTRLFRCGLVVFVLTMLLSAPVIAEPSPTATQVKTTQSASAKQTSAATTATKFLRILRDDDDRPLAMQTAIVHYGTSEKTDQGITVDLVAAVHIGEKSYFAEINRRLRDYDVVLYELVAPEGTRVPQGGGRSNHPVSMLQNGMKDLLGLEFQLEQIDYQRKNFVHADMSPDELSQSMQRRGEDPVGMFFRMMGRAIAQQARHPRRGSSDMAMFAAMLDKNRSLAMKRLMAEQFEDLEGALNIIEGPDGSALLSDRNKVAIGVLKEQIDHGKHRLAIFYGAGHMPDLERRLVGQFGLKRAGQQWIDAWDLRSPSKKPHVVKPPAGEKDKAASSQADG